MGQQLHFIVAGAGLGGLACALVLARNGQRVTLLEQAAEIQEAGAGIQLGPNAMRVLQQWGLAGAVLRHASQPESIHIRDVASGRSISRMLLGSAVQSRYGAPYATLRRADLQSVLLAAVQTQPLVQLHTAAQVVDVLAGGELGQGAQATGTQAKVMQAKVTQATGKQAASIQTLGVQVRTSRGDFAADALVGADGLYSAVRRWVRQDGPPQETGHSAYRALIDADQLPEALRNNEVGVWWGRNLHVVHYPVQAGARFNVVVLSSAPAAPEPAGGLQDSGSALWSHSAARDAVRQLCGPGAACPALAQWIDAAPQWQRWPLRSRVPSPGWSRGNVTLLGDAAHPMLPYLAQGASMALEDAWVLAQCVQQAAGAGHTIAQAFAAYEQQRYARTARVVHTARRNGQIFHLAAPWSLARNAVLRLKGTRVLGLPWLYGEP